ncbi:MAG: FAD-binding protein [Syntrophorhabdus aromaticivorans]|uniref:succinate dehydrogenase n=1 Tax=Syntrophorhabdus aromaticivorans TaxID=328301 RepID=A0A971M6J3_9BACT|nr:FAD-binding protein [Syntrophorhabdus aromaticivorans]
MLYHDVLIVGGGLAGLRAAVALCDVYDVGLFSKVHPIRSHSIAAQGGINAALANNPDSRDDTPEKHAFDTIKGSDYLADQDAVRIMCGEAPAIVYEMEHWGCPFSRFPDNTIAQRPFGGAGYPRTCFSADLTGHVLLNTLYERSIYKQVRVYPEFVALALVTDGNVCHGAVMLDQVRGEIVPVAAKATLFATGGYGQVYYYSTNALTNTGSGIGIPYKAGIPLKDMEFVQFHPTSLIGTNILMTEGCRGEGGYLLNNKGERFMEKYAPKAMELAPRDIVSRSIQTEIEEGRAFDHELGKYVNLDLRHLGGKKIMERLPGIRRICLDFIGIDPIRDPIPIMPAQHYSMGGIDTNVKAETAVKGFYAAGECACVSVHGANRLGGNSLLDTIVFGKLGSMAIDQYLQGSASKPDERLLAARKREVEEKVKAMAGGGTERPFSILKDLRVTMSRYAGIFRTGDELNHALGVILKLKERYRKVGISSPKLSMNYELIGALELESMLDVSHVIILGALAREESRGAHWRRDFPERRDADWLKHTVATLGKDGEPRINYSDVVISGYTPVERKY